MLFSAHYHTKLKKEIDEIRCPYNQLGEVIHLIKERANLRCVVIIPRAVTKDSLNKIIEQIELLRQITTNYTVQCPSQAMLTVLIDMEYNAYLPIPATDWAIVDILKKQGVSDIVIDGPLLLQQDKIRTSLCDINIRVNPVYSVYNNGIVSAYIRPEDLYLYEDIIKIIDFNCGQDPDREDTLVNIYKRGSFNYNINELIRHSDLPSVNNLLFKKDFAQARLNCGQECLQPGTRCHYCNTYYNVLKNLTELKN